MPCSTLIIIDDNLFWLVFIPLLLLLLVSLLFVQIKIRILFFGCWGFDRFSIQSQTDFFVFSYGPAFNRCMSVPNWNFQWMRKHIIIYHWIQLNSGSHDSISFALHPITDWSHTHYSNDRLLSVWIEFH